MDPNIPINQSKRQLRNNEVNKVNFANTDRYKTSTIPFLQNLLNEDEKTKANFIRTCGFK